MNVDAPFSSDLAQKRRRALRAALEGRGLSVNAAAKYSRISEGTLRNFIAGGDEKSMTLNTYDKLVFGLNSRGHDVTIGELLGDVPAAKVFGTERVTVIGRVQAGLFAEANELPLEDQFDIDVPLDPRYQRLPKRALKVVGSSMNLVYPEGSFVVVISPFELGIGYQHRNGQKVVVQRRDRLGMYEATVKEFVRDASGRPYLWPRSDDPQFQTPWPYPEGEEDAEVAIVAVVVGSYRPE